MIANAAKLARVVLMVTVIVSLMEIPLSWDGCQNAPSVGSVRPTVPAQTARPTSTGESP